MFDTPGDDEAAGELPINLKWATWAEPLVNV